MTRVAAPLVVLAVLVAACGGEAKQAARPTPSKPAIPPALDTGEMAKVAGGGTELGDGGPARSAGLCGPSGFAVDAAGSLYVADAAYECGGPGGKTVRRIDREGIITTVAGTGMPGFSGDGGAATSAQLSFPVAVAVDADGHVFVSDADALRVRRIDTEGTITTVVGTGRKGHSGDGGPARSARLTAPGGLAFDARGNLYLADGVAVRRIDRSGVITTVAGTGRPGFAGDGGPALDARLSAADVALDRDGNLYISDYDAGRVRMVNRKGIIRTVAGTGEGKPLGDGGPATAASLVGPVGVAVDRQGNLLVSEYDGGRIRKIGPRGKITTIAGGGEAVSESGPARDALLSGLWGLAVDEHGLLYFGDVVKGRVFAMRYDDGP